MKTCFHFNQKSLNVLDLKNIKNYAIIKLNLSFKF
jgi:hypothetical protein